MQETKSTCCYCGVGCGVVIAGDGTRISGVRGDPEHPANFGHLCSKGATLHLTARHDTRALYPEQREARSLARSRVSWDAALDHIALKFASLIRSHGPDSVAFYISGQLLTEDYYVFNKLAKGLIGTNNIDTNSRLCMSSAASGYKATLGADAPPTCYEDIAHAGCMFIAGANMAYAHPVLFRRVADAKAKNPALKLIVVDPRRTDTAAMADLHLPILPGSDIALCNAMLHVLLWEGLVDQAYVRAHTTGFDALKDIVRDYTPAAAAALCGVSAEDIVRAAKWFGACTPTLSFYCQGLNQSTHGTHNNAALINLHLVTGQIGKPGAGPFSLTGQPNAMGGREVGGMAHLLSAHRDLANPVHRAEVARLWGVDWLPSEPGLAAVELFQALESGKLKAVWIACTNPAQSMPDQKRVRAALAAAELVVLQEAYRNTDTAAYADVLLPASSWGEKEGTVTNSERRISRVRAAVAPPGEARADWDIVSDFARRLGAKLGGSRGERLFPYRSAEEVFNEHRESTRGCDLDITGLSYARLEAEGPQQWPIKEGAALGTARLYADGRFATADGRAQLLEVRHQDTAERVDARYPLHLGSGRLRDQWHGMSRTGTVARLFNHSPEPYASMHREDMARRGLNDGDLLRLQSRRGELILRVQAADEMRAGQVFVPMHWGSQFMRGAGVNALTAGDYDPHSRQPELKHAAVQAEKVEFAHTLVAMRRFAGDAMPSAQHLSERLQPLLAKFDYASVNLVGREHAVVVFRGYGAAPADAAVLREIDRLLALDAHASVMHYRDLRRGVFKSARVEGDAVIAVRLVGETAGEEWLKNMMLQGASVEAVRPWVLAPLAAPPRGTLNRGRIVCNCLDVSEAEIRRELAPGVTLDELQARLKCGTECGSCVPELKRMHTAQTPKALAPAETSL